MKKPSFARAQASCPPANVKELQLYLSQLQGKKILTIEESTPAQWLYTELKPYVDEIIVFDPYLARMAPSYPRNKWASLICCAIGWTDLEGTAYRLVIAYGTEETLIASFEDTEQNFIRPLFNIIYDQKNNGLVASERPSDLDKSPNRPLRIIPVGDGTLSVLDLDNPGKPAMLAVHVQEFPDLLLQGVDQAPSLEGTFEGEIEIPPAKKTVAQLEITLLAGSSIGNLQMLDGLYNSTLNFGSPGDNGIVYLTHTSVVGSGTWLQLRGRLESDGYFRGYAIFGGSGLMEYQFVLKKVW